MITQAMRPKILLDHGSSENLGDLAMLRSVYDHYGKHMPEVEPVVMRRGSMIMAGIPDHATWGRLLVGQRPRTQPLPAVTAAPEPGWLAGLRASAKARYYIRIALLRQWLQGNEAKCWLPDGSRIELKAVVSQFAGLHMVGGGYLTDSFPHEVFAKTIVMHAFLDAGKPVVLTGQQLGPLQGGIQRMRVRQALKRASFVGIREPGRSATFIRGLAEDKCRLMGDDSFGLEATENRDTEAYLDAVGIRGPFIAVNVRSCAYMPFTDDRWRRVADLLTAMRGKTNLPMVAIPIAFNESDDDVASATRLAGLVPGLIVLPRQGLEVSLVKALLARARLAIGVSYHFCTFALSTGVPTVSLYHGAYYQQKAKGIASLWGDPRFAMDTDIDFNTSFAQVMSVIGDDSIASRLRLRRDQLKESWEGGMHLAMSALRRSVCSD